MEALWKGKKSPEDWEARVQALASRGCLAALRRLLNVPEPRMPPW